MWPILNKSWEDHSSVPLKKLFSKYFRLIYFYVYGYFAFSCIFTICMRSVEGIRYPGIGVMNGCELKNELRSSERATTAPKHRVISPALELYFKWWTLEPWEKSIYLQGPDMIIVSEILAHRGECFSDIDMILLSSKYYWDQLFLIFLE